ncbi:MAG: holo-ACP synthase [Firmicutes bacterium]|nr:holo-ACP synthase [Bacillota bacterium]
MIQGCGIDLVEIKRIRRTINRFGSRFLAKVFTSAERTYSRARFRPEESFAARFAAKEAVAKALGLGLGQFCWHDIEIVRLENSGPQIKLTGRALARANALEVDRVLISLSHSCHYAVAQAIAVTNCRGD